MSDLDKNTSTENSLLILEELRKIEKIKQVTYMEELFIIDFINIIDFNNCIEYTYKCSFDVLYREFLKSNISEYIDRKIDIMENELSILKHS